MLQIADATSDQDAPKVDEKVAHRSKWRTLCFAVLRRALSNSGSHMPAPPGLPVWPVLVPWNCCSDIPGMIPKKMPIDASGVTTPGVTEDPVMKKAHVRDPRDPHISLGENL